MERTDGKNTYKHAFVYLHLNYANSNGRAFRTIAEEKHRAKQAEGVDKAHTGYAELPVHVMLPTASYFIRVLFSPLLLSTSARTPHATQHAHVHKPNAPTPRHRKSFPNK